MMPDLKNLSAKESHAVHNLRNFLLISLSLLLLPFSFVTTIFLVLLQQIGLINPPRRPFQENKTPRILITGVGMTKGLFLARTMHLGGCDVFGADFHAPGNLHCGRFSAAIRKFFALRHPVTDGVGAYIEQVTAIINEENVDLWISCSGVATARQDAILAREIKRRTRCKVFQFEESVVEVLDDKLEFMRKTEQLNMANLMWFPLSEEKDIDNAIRRIKEATDGGQHINFMIKSAGMDDTSRGSLPLVNSKDLSHAEQVLRSLDFSKSRTWILQEFVDSEEEYCTHSLIINGHVRAFTACPSASVLMHYRQVDTKSLLYAKMLKFTQEYVKGLGGNITGHLSFDFLIRYKDENDGICVTLVPIECNPRCHTATVLFEGREVELCDRYLEVLNGTQSREILETDIRKGTGFYWMAHDLVVLGLSSLLDLVLQQDKAAREAAVRKILDCVYHFLVWRDPTFVWWDPLPAFVLNHLYWPWTLTVASWQGIKWKQLNVSTTKTFKI